MAKKKSGGQEKYKKDYARQAGIACFEGGFTDRKLAKLFGVSKSTITTWKKKHPDFLVQISIGKDAFNVATAETSLLKSLKGYSVVESTRELVVDKIKGEDGEEELKDRYVVTKKVRKHVQGNVNAQKMFLYNRDPDRWRDTKHITADVNAQVELEAQVRAKVEAELLGENLEKNGSSSHAEKLLEKRP